MRLGHVHRLEDFGTRSLLNHGIMVVSFMSAILVALFVPGDVGAVTFIALLNFTGGMWLAHSIHALGTVTGDDEYRGIINELFDVLESKEGFDYGRFGRIVALIGVVTAISLLTTAHRFEEVEFAVMAVTLGTIALITAMTGFLLAVEYTYP